MTPIFQKQFLLQLLGIGQVTIMSKHNTKWRIDIKWLCFIVIDSGTRSRISHMSYARIAAQRSHVTRAEHVAYQAITLVQVEGISFDSGNTRSILPAMLQH